MKRSRIMALAAAVLLSTAAAGYAAPAENGPEGQPPDPPPETMLDDIVDRLLSTLRGLLQAVPQYEMPEVNEHGDIIIRRKRPPPQQPAPEGDLEAVET